MKVRKPKTCDQLSLIASKMKIELGTMDEMLEITKFVKTRIPSFNRASIIGGAPLGCVYSIHGPYGGGKSTFSALLLDSFVRRGHIALYIDAEHTVSKKWFAELGLDPKRFFFKRPTFFEQVVEVIDEMIEKFDDLKVSGDIGDETGLIIIIDTINKLTPEKEFKQFQDLGADALEKGLSRFRGLMIQTWLDHMTPIVGERNVALVCLAQEREVRNAKLWEDDYRVKGCEGLMYDAAVRLRVKLGSNEWAGVEKKKQLVGQKHDFYVFKNKVGYPREMGSFFIANGKGYHPIGYNIAKTAFVEATKKREGIIERSGAWYSFGSQRWNGEDNVIKALMSDESLLESLLENLDDQVLNKEVQFKLVKEKTNEEDSIESDEYSHDSSPLAT